jgi:glycine cleavage system aminomethyltransferase T
LSFDFRNLISDYGDVAGEVSACRTSAALFDFSFMFLAKISGPGSLDVIAKITDRNLQDMAPGRIRYALSYSALGYLCADLTIWRISTNAFLVMSGLSDNIKNIIEYSQISKDCYVEDLSERVTVYAVQGPESLEKLNSLVNDDRLSSLPYFGFAEFNFNKFPCLIGRLGYTGERGFEIVLPLERSSQVWKLLSSKMQLSGFSAMDRLRIEAGFILFANEFQLPVSAVDVSLQKFTQEISSTPRYRLICFKAETNEKLESWCQNQAIYAPPLGCISITSACSHNIEGLALGLGFVLNNNDERKRDFIDPLGKFKKLIEVNKPFYDTTKKRPRGNWE